MFGDLPSTSAVLVVITRSSVGLKVWEVNPSGPFSYLNVHGSAVMPCGTKMDSFQRATPLQLVREAFFKLGLEMLELCCVVGSVCW